MPNFTRQQVLAFRQHQQYLSTRATPGELSQVAALGIQNTPPDSALLAIGVRLDRFSREDFDLALQSRKTLLQFWGLRSAPYITPVCSDKDLLVPEHPLRRQIWRVVGSPGAVLSNGEIAGVWRLSGIYDFAVHQIRRVCSKLHPPITGPLR